MHRQYRVHIIGAGKVGKTLGRLIHEQRIATIDQVVCQHIERAQAACDLIGQGQATELSKLTNADVYIITTRDAQIKQVCDQLCDQGLIHLGSLVVHCSGVLTSEVLAKAKAQGARVCSIHPLKCFSKVKHALKTMKGTSWVAEGDSSAIEVMQTWVNAWGGTVRLIQPEHKPAYHAACVLAGAGLTTLFDATSQLLRSCGFSSEDVNDMLPSYLGHILSHNVDYGSKKALTGPVVRNDYATIALHQKAIAQLCPDVQDTYNQMLIDSMSLIQRD